MILEMAILPVRAGAAAGFEAAFKLASPIIARAKGHISHELQRCVEHPERYVLLVRWETLDDHMVGFRESADFQEWRALLHYFYDPKPEVLHYEVVATRS